MDLRKMDLDVYVGGILTLAGLFLFSEANKFSEKASYFPKITITLFIIFSIMMLAQGIRKSIKNQMVNEKSKKLEFEEIKYPLLIFLFVAIYTLALKFFGFYISTALFIPAVMIFYKNRNKLVLIFTTLGTVLFIHLLFVVKLKLTLP